MGYTAELSFFEGHSYEDILARTDLGTDAETSATKTNVALRAMVLECFCWYDYNVAGYEEISYAGSENIVRAERRGDLYRFTVNGIADLVEYNYKQQLSYAVTVDAGTNTLLYITTLTESTFGYTLDKPVFLGKTEGEIAAMTEGDIQADITTGATVTNLSFRGLAQTCFDAARRLQGGE